MHGRISHLVLADIAHGSVVDALGRYREKHTQHFPALFISGDAFGRPLCSRLDPALRFHMVSCQFAFHYAFDSEERLRTALRNISERLEPGGYFVGTVPNAYRLVHLLRASRGLKWSNSICSLVFDESTDKDLLPDFGARYIFTLEDAVDGVPEYLVHFAVLERIAQEYELDLVLREEFPDFFANNQKEHEDLLTRMGVHVLSPDEWQAASLYVCFCFRKRGPPVTPTAGGQRMVFNHDYNTIMTI